MNGLKNARHTLVAGEVLLEVDRPVPSTDIVDDWTTLELEVEVTKHVAEDFGHLVGADVCDTEIEGTVLLVGEERAAAQAEYDALRAEERYLTYRERAA